MKTYKQRGIKFNYPENWKIQETDEGEQASITVLSPETSFWSVTVFEAPQDSGFIIDQVLDTLRDEYETLDVYDAKTKLCDVPNVSVNVEFICLELVNGAFLRSIAADDFHLLVYFQGTDHELEETRPILEAISASLKITRPTGVMDFFNPPSLDS